MEQIFIIERGVKFKLSIEICTFKIKEIGCLLICKK